MKEGGGASFSLLTVSVGGEGGEGKFSVSFEDIFSSQGCKQLLIEVESCCFERNNIDCPSFIPDLLQSEL